MSSDKFDRFNYKYEKLGHLNVNDVVQMSRKGIVTGMTKITERTTNPCYVCSEGKLIAPRFPKKSNRKTKLLEIVHSDVCGPMRTESRGKKKYFVTFIDDHSHCCEIYFLANKDDVFSAFKLHNAYAEKKCDANAIHGVI